MKTKLIPPPQYPKGKHDNKTFSFHISANNNKHKLRLGLLKSLDAKRLIN